MLHKKYLLIAFIFAAIATWGILLTPKYVQYKQHSRISKVIPLVDQLQNELISHAKTYGYFPERMALHINGNKLYDITTWANDRKHANTPNGQIAVLQAQLNGKTLALKAGAGGMVTCIMALRNNAVESKCFYQVKMM